jgi:hypothetical protein
VVSGTSSLGCLHLKILRNAVRIISLVVHWYATKRTYNRPFVVDIAKCFRERAAVVLRARPWWPCIVGNRESSGPHRAVSPFVRAVRGA